MLSIFVTFTIHKYVLCIFCMQQCCYKQSIIHYAQLQMCDISISLEPLITAEGNGFMTGHQDMSLERSME